MYTEKIKIGSGLVDSEQNLKLSCFFQIMQEVAMNAVKSIGIDEDKTLNKGILWVITRVRLEINRMPKYNEEVTFSTYAGRAMSIIYPRHMFVNDKNGNRLMTFSSCWTLIDSKTRQIYVNKELSSINIEESYPDELPLPSKIEEDNQLFIYERKINYSDVDINNHLNNARYIEIIQDLHNSSFYKEHKIQSITLNYNREILENNIVKVFSNNKNPEIVTVKNNDITNFIAKIEYKR